MTDITYAEPMPSKKPLLTLVMDPDLIKRLDDFRFERRFSSRAAAIKWLLEWGLNQNPPTPKQ